VVRSDAGERMHGERLSGQPRFSADRRLCGASSRAPDDHTNEAPKETSVARHACSLIASFAKGVEQTGPDPDVRDRRAATGRGNRTGVAGKSRPNRVPSGLRGNAEGRDELKANASFGPAAIPVWPFSFGISQLPSGLIPGFEHGARRESGCGPSGRSSPADERVSIPALD